MFLLFAKLEDYMLPCLNKTYLGFECMGCGVQRAAILLIKGEFTQAFEMYPAIYSIVTLFGFILLNHFKSIKNADKIIITLSVLNVAIIIGSFSLKYFLK